MVKNIKRNECKKHKTIKNVRNEIIMSYWYFSERIPSYIQEPTTYDTPDQSLFDHFIQMSTG